MIRQVGVPFLLLVFLLYLGMSGEDVKNSLGLKLSHQSQQILLNYLFLITLWFAVAWFLDRFIVGFLWDTLTPKNSRDSVQKLLKNIVTVIIFFMAIIGILTMVFEQSLKSILLNSAVIAIVLGLIFQSLIFDTVASIGIHLDKSYQMGDWVRVHGDKNVDGCIVEINWRNTLIRTRKGNQVTIPNRKLGQLMVTNYMKPDLPSRQTLVLTLDFSIPADRSRRMLSVAIKVVLGENQLLEEPSPQVIFSDVNSSGIEYTILFWIKGDADPELTRHLVVKSIVEHLQLAGLSIATSKQSVFHAPMLAIRPFKDSTETRVELLSRLPLFSVLDKEALNKLANHLLRRLYKEGSTIVKQGNAGDSMFLVAEGLLHIFTELSDEKHKVKIGQVIGGQFFGEMSLLTKQTRSATVVAATDSILYEISRNDISPLLKNNPDFAESINKIVANRRLQTLETLATSAKDEKQAQNENMAKEIVAKMRTSFRGCFGKK